MNNNRTKSEHKRELIINASMKLFTQYGFNNITMKKIADHAGVSKQTVYSHFGSKEELFTAAMSDKCMGLILGKEDLSPEQPAASRLLQLALDFGQFITSEDAVKTHTLCAFESQNVPELAVIFFEAGPNKLINMLTDYLAAKDEQGELTVPQPRWAACQFLSIMMGEAHMRVELNVPDKQTDEEREAYLRASVKFFLKAYAPE